MKITFKTVNTILIISAIIILSIRLRQIEKQSDRLEKLVESGQLKCKKPN